MAGDREEHAAEERSGGRERADVDAIGLEKRRQVVGGSYGPSAGKQIGAYATFLAVVAILVIGFVIMARELDQPPERHATEAPWAQPGVEQVPPRPIDFPRNGRPEVD